METCIRLNYKILKAELQPGEIADMLYEDGLLDDENIERISEAKERRFKCDVLLKAIRRKGNDFPLERLFDILKRTGFEYVIQSLETVTFEENCKCKYYFKSIKYYRKKVLLLFFNTIKQFYATT